MILILILSTAALLTGFVLDCIFGDPYWFPHIIRWIGTLISFLEKCLRRICPSGKRGERIGGCILVFFVLLISAGLPFLLLFLSYTYLPVLGYILESFLCYQLLAAKCLRDESMKVYDSLVRRDLEDSRRNISMIVGRDTAGLNETEIARAAVETVAENTSDGVIAPLFYFFFGGAVLGCFYKAINTMDSMIGYKNEKYLYFGRAAAKLDDAVNFIPSRLSAILMIVASRFPGFNRKNAFRIWTRDKRKHASPNSAQTEAVCAGALGIRLAGPSMYFGVLHDKPYIGDDLRPVEPEDIIRANRLMYITAFFMLFFSSVIRSIIFTGVMMFGSI